jgi:hypothetical protein
MDNWIKIYHDNNEYKVELIKNELLNHNIQAVILNKVDHNYPVFGLSELMVSVTDKDIALTIINDFIKNEEKN